jgi:hypothetical protein
MRRWVFYLPRTSEILEQRLVAMELELEERLIRREETLRRLLRQLQRFWY